MTEILKVLCGSQAHGLANEDSDYDYRGVFVIPTSEMLKLGSKIHNTSWIEGKDDDTSWEIGHFLNLAVHSNPSILEAFLSPRVDNPDCKDQGPGVHSINEYYEEPYTLGDELKALFPYVWSSEDVKDSFIGYSHNQRKKFLEDKDNRPNKYAAAALRVLYNGYELLSTNTFTIRIADTPVGEQVRRFKNGNYTRGDVIDALWNWEQEILRVYKDNPDKKTDIDKVNEFLLKIRQNFWN